jgi:hypothetical protein
MKKILLTGIAICVSLQLMSQQQALSAKTHPKKGIANPTMKKSGHASGADTRATTIFSENFSTGISSWTIVDNAGGGEIWEFTTTGMSTGTFFLNPVGTTASNGYIIFDSDADGAAGTPENSDITSPVINCSSNSTVFLSFNEFYQEYQFDSSLVLVSNNGTTWTSFYCPDIALNFNQAGPNPNNVTLDISSVAANQSTVYVRFHWQGDWDYWWMVDDVTLYEPDAVDAQAFLVNPVNSQYTKLPLTQATSMSLSGTVKNLGGTNLTGATALFEVVDTVSTTVVFSSTATIPTTAVLANSTVTAPAAFTPSGVGYYRTRMTVTAAGDGNVSDNVLSSDIITHVNDSIYARDNNIQTGTLGIGAGPSNGILGQSFLLPVTDILTSVSFFISDIIVPTGPTPFYVTVHPQTGPTAPGSSIASTDTFMLNVGSIPPGGMWITLPISGGPISLAAGQYVFGVSETDVNICIGTTTSIFTPQSTWITWATIPTPPAVGGWASNEDFNFFVQFMLRPNFGPSILSTQEFTENSFGIYPNPSSDIVNLVFENDGEKNITVFSSLGQQVMSLQTSGTTAKLNFSSLKSGVYIVKLGDGRTREVTIVR